MGLSFASIRTRLVLLVAGVALLVGGVSGLFQLRTSGQLLEQQLEKRGRYIASNLAYNSKYGVLTEDKPLLNQTLEGAVGTEGDNDVIGAVVRDASGAVLAQRGATIKDLPPKPASVPEHVDGQAERSHQQVAQAQQGHHPAGRPEQKSLGQLAGGGLPCDVVTTDSRAIADRGGGP